jgi:hypothetical protein
MQLSQQTSRVNRVVVIVMSSAVNVTQLIVVSSFLKS